MKKTDKVILEYVEVSPALAAEWLSRNISIETARHDNRKLKEGVYKKYLGIMQRGEWNERNGETIKFDRDGNLIDGQHRLLAQVVTGKTMWWSVAFNCSDDAFVTVDNGSLRSAGDVVSMLGEKSANVLASAMSMYHRYINNGMMSGGAGSPTNSQIMDMLRNTNETAWRHSVEMAVRNRAVKGLVSPSIAAFLHYVGSQTQGADRADQFLLAVCTCSGPSAGNQAINLLRNRLFENATATRRMPRIAIVAWCVKAWNAYIAGEAIGKGGLRYKYKATRNEKGETVVAAERFPAIA